MYLTYFKREFAKKHGNSGVLTRFVLFLSGMGSRIVARGKTRRKNNATEFIKNSLTEYGFRVKIHIIIIER